MFYILRQFINTYKYYDAKRDMRTDQYFLMGSPLKILSIIAIYLYFVKNLGPKLMENRKPFQLKKIMMIYNFIQVMANMIITFGALHILYGNPKHKLKCLMPDFSTTYYGYLEANLTYAYFILKVSDLLDTIFFVLRKKTNQVTFLHVYHHVFMCLGSFTLTRWLPGGHAGLIGLLNGFVHILMYSYYLITTIRPSMAQTIWWKKYITQIQILQFSLLFIHFLHPLLIGNCKYPIFWLLLGFIQNLFMLTLFLDFYYKAYIKTNNYKKQNIVENGFKKENIVKNGYTTQNGIQNDCTKQKLH